ncbi:SEC-C metal-binding domain-containing protein [Neobacillus cucumis]|uniref:SEC-C metal-binding domain-containing protein n=1 Tax=Neobacillus cucumis TaxID=1740721 RepID=UPI002E20D940|nr:SEC-C metal-binding domain-containing protein [Neobacillus cucumis]MED4225745.1 SEC-C metal-binding domain-containing protein [Neobacillus cucumis]
MNTSSTDKENYKKLLGALVGMKEMTRKSQEKRELKMWSDISVPLTIKDALSRLSKDELSEIRRKLDLKGVSHLKKGELIDLISVNIPLSLENTCSTLDQERYNLIKKIVHHGGYIEAPNFTLNQLNFFRNMGIIFPGIFNGKKIIAIPEEIVGNPFMQDNHKEFITITRRNTEWIKLTHGLLFYYGTLNLTELHDLLEKYMNEPVRLSEYLSVINHAISYYKQIRFDQYGYSNIRVFDPNKVKSEHKARKDLAFFPFTKQQLLRAGEPGYNERNESYLQFVHFLTQNYEISKHEADEIVEECVYATNIGESPNHILQFLQSRLEFENLVILQACMDKVVNFMNNTKQWFLKGYSPRELSAAYEQQPLQPVPNPRDNIVDFTTRQKVGRNDPCPCGSNKKYKKCCGRK